jgi:predicted lipoprotein
MFVSVNWLGIALVAAAALALSACSTPQHYSSGAALDAAYGIPPDSVPPYLMQPDGLLINGLLPKRPNEES